MTKAVEPNARKTPRQQRSRALVTAILDATVRILIEDGYAALTTNRVADRAGVSVGSLYQYFANREALVAAVARRQSEQMKDHLEAQVGSRRGETLADAVRTIVDAVAELHARDDGLMAILASEVPRADAMDWRRNAMDRGVAIATLILDRHCEELPPDLDRHAAPFVIAHSMDAVLRGVVAVQRPSNEAIMIRAALADMITTYVRGAPSRAR